MSRCRGVAPGGAEALHCLQRNTAQLSPNCRNAVAALGAGAPAPAKTAAPAAAPARTAAPAAAPAQPTAQQQAAIKQSCQSDFMARCRGVQPGGAQALQCLQRNSAQLSPNCRNAVAALGGAAAPAAATASAPATAAPAAAPTAQQQNAIKFTCRRDFGVHCRGVPQGGPEALACLQRNAARLSPDCKTSIAAISDEQAATVAPAAAPAPAGAAPAGPFPLRRAIRERMLNRQ
jgi:hypothetical protein